jgi:hypothetical protein
MDRAKAKAWRRFYDQVLSRPDWPRGLRFAAVEDALRAALGTESRLLADYRADLAELLRLERAPSGAHEKRIAQLEAQIRGLIELANETIMQAEDPGEDAPAPAAEAAAAAIDHAGSRPGRTGSLVPAVVLLLAGVAGAATYYELRMAATADQQIALMTRLLDHRVADLRADLDQRLEMADRLHERMSYLHAELSADIDEFGAEMTESVRSITALSDNLIDELELSAEGGGVSESIRLLRARADELAQGLDEADLELAPLESRLPELHDEVRRMSTGVQQIGTDFAQVHVELDAVKAKGPELAAWLAGQKDELERALRTGRGALGEIDAQVGEFESEVGRSRELLQQLNRAQSESHREVEAAGRKALDDLAQARETQLGLLAARISATQRELEQTRAGLAVSWQRMDQTMAERQSRVLARLDSYASTIEARVKEFLNALDVIVARTGG